MGDRQKSFRTLSTDSEQILLVDKNLLGKEEFIMPIYEEKNFSEFQHRRQKLLDFVKSSYLDTKIGGILLFANFEHDRVRFRQDSTFYYFTGIEEPGAALWIDLSGQSILYLPDYKGGRDRWIAANDDLNQGNAERFGFDKIDFLGKPCVGYTCYSFFGSDEYAYLLEKIVSVVRQDGTIFTCAPKALGAYQDQRLILDSLNSVARSSAKFPIDLLINSVDISSFVAHMRRKKDKNEIELMYKAVELTMLGHSAAASLIAPGVNEYQVQAGLEFIFTSEGGSCAFPTIIASGKNSTILHYTLNNRELKKGDLVLVDIGAEYNYYCGDLSRTYPVSGEFSKDQAKLYQLVLDAQEYIAEIAKPGMWLNNSLHPEKSLHHIAKKYFDDHGDYGQFFYHGIGHFLGLDVHDVGDILQPLAEGDVFTIEPGLYLSDKNMGVRIEDNYLMMHDGVVCLSEELPKQIDEIVEIVGQLLDE
ncbi:MAG TPA: aminopeptidase P N-terminal domain-containing protein [Candidatus Babeliales bacterium]|nr:aminopeptidase P N-terminal domain-containing protein [Candidatus Babeliales bacterium]